MDRPDFQEEIRELNLAYLMLAQQMLRSDRRDRAVPARHRARRSRT